MLVRLLFVYLLGWSLTTNAQVELLSLEGTYQEKNLIVNLNAAVSNLDSNGYFYFNVN